MKVTLASDLFEPEAPTELSIFLWLSLNDRHRVFVDDPDSSPFKCFLAQLAPKQREEWEKVLEFSLELDGREPSVHEIHVVRFEDSRWSSDPPRLTTDDALVLLLAPYRILVEDGISDWAFLLSFCSEPQRSYLQKRAEKEWLEVEHGGGLEHMNPRVKSIRQHHSKVLRCSVLFDSDAICPGKPSKQSQKLEELCGFELHHHQLERRYIESYLPIAALERWSRNTSGNQREKRRTLLEAFKRLRPEQRHHFNMKEGLDGDTRRTETVRPGPAQTFLNEIVSVDQGASPPVSAVSSGVVSGETSPSCSSIEGFCTRTSGLPTSVWGARRSSASLMRS